MTPDSHTLVDSAPDRKDALQMAEEQLVRALREITRLEKVIELFDYWDGTLPPDPTGITPGEWIARDGGIWAHNWRDGAAPICITEVLRPEDARYMAECVKFVRGK